MCGIIGYIGEDASSVAVSSLKKLEYRGYDSSGIATILNNKIEITKCVGEIANLEKALAPTPCKIAIAHTRWATHGKATKENAHPHQNKEKTLALVHNGIIENFEQLKKQYHLNPTSQTDTEIAAMVISKQPQPNNLAKLISACKQFVGSYAFALIDKNQPSTIYLAKQKSPLFVATNKNSSLASSDPICFCGKYKNYYTLADNEFCVMKKGELLFFNKNQKQIKKKPQNVGGFENSANKNHYAFFAEKEVNQTPEVAKKIIKNYSQTNYLKNIDAEFLKNINQIHLIGCGTAYHACLMGASYLEKKLAIPASAHIASEYIYSKSPNKNTLCIFLSQSGETADTILSLKKAKQNCAKTLAIVNVPYSTIAKQCNITLPCFAGAEIAVISTKAYTSMLCVLKILSSHISKVIANKKQITCVSSSLKNLTKKSINNFSGLNKLKKLVLENEKIIFLGKSEDYITAQEASLKLKEITYINSIALPSGELKHGSLALVDSKTLAIFISTNPKTHQKNLSSASEIKARGGKVAMLTNLELTKADRKKVDYVYSFAKTPASLSSIASIIPLQKLAISVCIAKGLNPDKPRNLAKSVTVE